MTNDRAGSFLHLLRESNLLEPAQMEELTGSPDAGTTEPRVLGQCLVELGWLTPYQLDRLLTNRSAELKLSAFVLLDRLGEGPAGPTYKARRPGKPGLVALKVIPKKRIATTDAGARFQQDVRAAAQLQHPHIAPVVSLGQVGDQYLFARAFVHGTDVDRLVRESGHLAWFRACSVIHQTALALEHAHAQGLVHHRIKPANLIAERRDGELDVKLVDFGLAQLGSAATLPVQKPADPDADLRALGRTMHYLLLGQATLTEAFNIDEDKAPGEVATILGRLMKGTGADGFRSAGEAARALEPFTSEPIIAETVPSPDLPVASAAVAAVPLTSDLPAAPGANGSAPEACSIVPAVSVAAASLPQAQAIASAVTPVAAAVPVSAVSSAAIADPFAFMVFVVMSSVGLPGLNGFIGEALSLMGIFEQQYVRGQFPIFGVVGAIGMFLGAWYLLTMLLRVFFGPLKEPPVPAHEHHDPIRDLSLREVLTLVPVVVFCLLIGLYPQPMLDTMRPDVGVIESIADRARARLDNPVVAATVPEEAKP